MKRGAIGFLLGLALLLGAFQLPAQGCAMPMPQPAMPCGDCCATMKSCALPQHNPVQQTATSDLSQQSIVLIAPDLTQLSVQSLIAGQSRLSRHSATEPATHSPPRQAVLCTFLI
jgi:hypothetical protein